MSSFCHVIIIIGALAMVCECILVYGIIQPVCGPSRMYAGRRREGLRYGKIGCINCDRTVTVKLRERD